MNFGPNRFVILTLCLFFGITSLAQWANAQVSAGALHGQVTDPSGASIANATVLLTTPAGDSMEASSGRDGSYDFKGLVPGTYSLKAVAQGFALFARDKFEITAGKTLTLNIALSIEVQEQKVVVTDSSTQVDINPANNAGAIVLKGKDLEALSDDPDELQSELQALAGPSAGPNGGQMYIDGFTAGQLPPKASIREIRINQNPFSAEYDRLGYGRVEIFTKPGTDKFHGQIYASGNTAALNARNPFNIPQPGVPDPGYHSTQFSGNIGGPLSKKASFFFNIERRDINSLNIVSTPVDPNTLQNVTFSDAVPNPNKRTNLSQRLDYQVSANNTLTARYQYERENEENDLVGGFSLASQGINSHNSEHSLQVSDTQTLGPRVINETRFQYNHEINGQTPLTTAPSLNVQGGFVSGGNGGGISDDTQNRYELQNNTYFNSGKHALKFGGRLRVTRDVNQSSSGYNGAFTFNDLHVPVPNGCPSAGEILTGVQVYQVFQANLASLTLPVLVKCGLGPGRFSITVPLNQTAGAIPSFDVTYVDTGLFVQDDWRIRPNLTFSYGLRFETQNNFSDNASFAPRVGLAWGVDGGAKKPAKTVIRLGYGIFYDRFSSGQILRQEQLSGNVQQQFIVTNPDFYYTVAPPSLPNLGTSSSAQTIYVPNPKLRAPYTMQTGLSVERQLGKSANLAVTYLSSRGVRLFHTENTNPFDLATGLRIIPGEGNVLQYQNGGIFKQNQLIVNSSVRIGAKFSLFGYYTLNYANSDTSGGLPSVPFNLSQDYGRAAYDVRHRVNMGGSIGLPYAFRLSPFLIASSGSPFNIVTSLDPYQDQRYGSRPALVDCPSVPMQGKGIYATRFGCLDGLPQPGMNILPINYGEGPGRFSLNLRLGKTFGFGKKTETANSGGVGGPGGGGTFGRGPGGHGGGGRDGGRGMDGNSSNQRYSFTFSVSARNIFNHVNLATPNGLLGSLLFDRSNGLAGRPYSDSTSNRRLDLQLTFNF